MNELLDLRNQIANSMLVLSIKYSRKAFSFPFLLQFATCYITCVGISI